MARFTKAAFHAVRNFTEGGQEQVLGLVVHIMDGTLEGSQSWFNNPASQASSHFGTGRDGELRQWVDTKDRAWAQGSGNRTYLSIENEGRGGDSLTAEQIEAVAKTFAWTHLIYQVPLRRAAYAGDKGLAYHALGGAAWGSHPNCPGPKIIAQLDKIVARAKVIAGEKAPVPLAPFPGDGYFYYGRTSKLVTEVGKALVRAGYKGYRFGPGPVFTASDRKAIKWFQLQHAELRGDADGHFGPKTWKLLRVHKPE